MYPRIIAKGVSSPLDVLDQTTYTFPSGGSPSTNSPRATFQTAAAEVVNAVSFLPGSDQHLLAGVAGRFLRLYDLRLGATAAIAASVNMTCKVQGLATDPLDHNRFGCWGDGLVTVWDQRQPTTALLTFSASDAGIDTARRHSHGSGSVGIITHLEFSPTRRGLLATLEKDSSYVRLWDIQQTPLGRDGMEIGAGQLGKGTTRNDGGQTRVSKISWTSPAALMSSWTGSGNAPAEPTPILQPAPGLYRAVLANSWSSEYHEVVMRWSDI
jgi:WD40 repeat protein